MAKKRSGKGEKENNLRSQLFASFAEAKKRHGDEVVVGVLSEKFESVNDVEDINKAISTLGKSLGNNGLGRLQNALRQIDKAVSGKETTPAEITESSELSVREQLRQGLLIKQTNDEADISPDAPQCA